MADKSDDVKEVGIEAGAVTSTDQNDRPIDGKLKLTENNVGEASSAPSNNGDNKEGDRKSAQDDMTSPKAAVSNPSVAFKLPQMPVGKFPRPKPAAPMTAGSSNTVSNSDKSEEMLKDEDKAKLPEKKTESSRTADDGFAAPKLPIKLSKSQSKVRTEKATDIDVTSTSSSEKKKEPATESQDSEKTETSAKVGPKKQNSSSSNKLSPAEKLAKREVPLPYKEPSWSGIPRQPYTLEILKGGAIVSTFSLNEKPFLVFGRLESCDVMLEHPSLSRYHMVLQYRSVGDSDNDPGFYVYDLDSTHGSFLNKQKLKPKTYSRMQVGHMFKLAGSTRLFILQGPSEDEEAESELSVTELKQMREKQLIELEKRKMQEKEEKEEKQRQEEEEKGISWGMDDDAEEEDPSEDNPFSAMTQEEREELYIKDPKKTLRGFFEREGHELEYDVEEKDTGHGRQYICRVELPIDDASGRPITAEAAVSGKKKESVIACAMEACRILDAHGVLRQAKHESKKKKAKNWADDDYYDSDDDTFLDRTGEIEKKRQARMKKAGVIKEEVETFASLTTKLANVESEMNQIDQEVEILKQSIEQSSSDDSLDAFMSSIKSGKAMDKTKKAKLKIKKIELRKEQARLLKLINIARPAALPEIKRQAVPSKDGSSSSTTKQLPMIGSLKGRLGAKKFKFLMPSAAKPVVQPAVSSTTPDFEEEEEEDDDDDDGKVVPMETGTVEEKSQEKSKGPSGDNASVSSSDDGEGEQRKSDDKPSKKIDRPLKGPTLPPSHSTKGPSLPPGHSIKGPSLPPGRSLKGPSLPPSGRLLKGPSLPPVIKGPTLPPGFNVGASPSKRDYEDDSDEEEETSEKKKKPTPKDALESEEDVTDWQPPEGQTGDGRTALNEKFGY